MESFIKSQIRTSISVKEDLYNDGHALNIISDVANAVIEAYKHGNRVLLAGNGGSAADAQHIAGEFVSRFYFDRPGLPAQALTTDTSVLTAIGNDYGYEELFARQIQANGKPGDVFIGISTSGNSKNVLRALEQCRLQGIVTVGFTGNKGGSMVDLCEYCVRVPSTETPRIQEAHILIGHIICAIVEEQIFGKGL